MTRTSALKITLAFAGIYIIWGTTFLAIALMIRTIPPFLGGAIRFIAAGALLYGWLRLHQPRPFRGLNIGTTIWCGVLLSGIGNGFVMYSQLGLPSGIAALFVAVLPVLVLILDRLFFSKRPPSLQGVAGVALGLIGVLVLGTNTLSMHGSVRPVHIAAVLLAEIGWGLGTLLQPRAAGADRVMAFSSLQMLAGGVFQGLMALLHREWVDFHPAAVSAASVLALLYLMAIGSLVAVNCYSYLVAHVAAQKVTTYALVNPVIALALGALVLHEHIGAAAVLSTVLVLLGVALVLFQPPKLRVLPRAGSPAA